jgi:hypothetical protein
MARDRDFARGVRPAPDHFADLAVAEAPAVADDHCETPQGPWIGATVGILPQLKMKFKVVFSS